MRKPTTRTHTEYFVMATHKRRTTCLSKTFLISQARRARRWFTEQQEADPSLNCGKLHILAITTTTTTKTFEVVE